MNSHRTFAIACVAVIVGLVLVWLVLEHRAQNTPSQDPPQGAPSHAKPIEAASPQSVTQTSERQLLEPQGVSEPQRPTVDPAARQDTERVFSGKCIDREGRPLAGAMMRIDCPPGA